MYWHSVKPIFWLPLTWYVGLLNYSSTLSFGVIPCQINIGEVPEKTISDFCNIWHMCRPLSDEMKGKISAPNWHPFQNTAKFYGRGDEYMLSAESVFVTFITK